MDSTSAIRAMVERSGLSAREASTLAGRSPDYLGGILYRGSSPSLATAADLAKACGQVVAILPNDRVPDCAIVIDPPEASR